MKISADKKILLPALARIQGIAEKSSIKPITAHVLLQAKEKMLIVAATNLQIGTKATYLVNAVHEEGEILVNARMLFDIIKEMPDGVIDIEEKERYTVEIKSGKKVKFKISGFSPEDFPMTASDGAKNFVAIKRTRFLEMLDVTYFSMARDETTINIHGAYLENIEGGITRIVTTDGFRLSIADENFETPPPLTAGILIPYKGIIELHKILHEKKDEEKIYLFTDDRVFYVRVGEIEYSIYLIEKKFPDYRVIIPGDGYKKFEVMLPRDELIPALKRMAIISNENTRPVLFTFKDKKLDIRTEDSDIGMVNETLTLTHEQKAHTEEIAFCLNCSYLLDILLAVQDDIFVEYNIEEKNKPLIIRPVKKKDQVKYVVMPMLMD
ncbi:MAG: DNA polymerase III subunit beta [Desulfobacterota bacterium]|nr:DNA polymerase III subunit beta [Thermodesulfobacteriota bacterium]